MSGIRPFQQRVVLYEEDGELRVYDTVYEDGARAIANCRLNHPRATDVRVLSHDVAMRAVQERQRRLLP